MADLQLKTRARPKTENIMTRTRYYNRYWIQLKLPDSRYMVIDKEKKIYCNVDNINRTFEVIDWERP